MKENFDLASYPKTSTIYDGPNNKVVGKFKDESNWDTIVEFLAISAKIYSYQTFNTGAASTALCTKKRANGLQMAAVTKLRHLEFKAHLDHPEE